MCFRNVLACSIAGVLALACQDAPGDARVVVARVGSDLSLGTGAESTRMHRLAGSWRHALDASRFEIAVPPAADTLAWSCGGSPGTYTIELRAGDQSWQPFDRGRVETADRWLDFERPLPPGPSRVLRFQTASSGPEDALLWGSVRFLGPLPAPRRPDVLLLSLDTLGAGHLGAYGGPAGVSPHLDALLSSSAWFERAYAQYGNTLVSHSSLFSALYPIRHGTGRAGSRHRLERSLVGLLADAGYETRAFTDGGYVSAGFGFGRSFDQYDDGEPGLTEKRTPGAAFDAALRYLSGSPPPGRRFLFVHTYEVHNPYLPSGAEPLAFANALTPGDDRWLSVRQQRLLVRDASRAGRLPPARDLRRLEALYRGEVHALDARVARFLDAASAYLADPLVIVLADHGEQFGEWGRVRHGSSLHDRVIHVPLAFRMSGIEARSIREPVQLVDVMPTVLDLLGLDVPPALDGRSLVPLLRGETLAPGPAVAEQGRDNWGCDHSASDCRVDRVAIIDGRFKLVDSRFPEVRRQLYDLQSDPSETRDVSVDRADVVEALSARAADYRSLASGADADAPDDSPDPDAETRGLLRALGYEQDDE